MLDWTVDDAAGTIEIMVDGAIGRDDYGRLMPVLEALIARHGQLRVIEIMRKLGPIDWSLWWQDLTWVAGHHDKLARCAVVTDHGWIGPVARAAAALFAGEIRVFPERRVEEARAWARGC